MEPTEATADPIQVTTKADESLNSDPTELRQSDPADPTAEVPRSDPLTSESYAAAPSDVHSRDSQARADRTTRDWRSLGILLLLLAVALALRLYDFNWDSSSSVHPDERAISGWVDRLSFPHNPFDMFNPTSTWNPGWNATANSHDPSGFNYGSLPLYLIYFFSHLLSWLGGIFPWWSSWRNATGDPDRILAGRVLSAFADTITVYLVYLIGSHLAGKVTGLFAAALATFTVLSIQLSHFTTVDILLTTFCTAAVLSSIDLFTHGRPRDYVLTGIWIAAAVATKASAVPLVALVPAAHLWRQARLGDLGGWRTFIYPGYTAIAAAVGLLFFQPFTYFDWSTFWSGVQGQSDLARGTTLMFYTLKWAGTKPIIYPLQQLTYFSLGIPLALLAYAGLLYEGVRVFTPRRNAGALVALFVVVYFISAGTLYMKYLRYMEPIVPALCVLAALLVSALVRERSGTGGVFSRRLGLTLGGLVLLLTACYGLAYEHIYSQPLTRIQASCWMFAHIPSTAHLLEDGIDETLPVGNACAVPAVSYMTPTLATYDEETLSKVQTMATALSQAQWYIITSRRSIDTFMPQPVKYPFTSRFYRLLFAPNHPLGFTLVEHVAVTPKLGPWSLNESGANQNFNEYDHPPVWIFKNTGNLTIPELVNQLTDFGRIAAPSLYATPPKSLLLTPKEIATNQHSPSYGQMFPANSLPMRLPMLVWLVMVEVIGLLALPISMRLFSRLCDGGWLLAKTAGILMLSYFAWILASLHIAEYSRQEIALCLLPIAAISLLWGVRLSDIVPILRARRTAVLVSEAVFLAGFAAFVYIRMVYPDLWHGISGGEKTMDFSFLQAIVRSRVMPPYDPWYGGGYLNYYYYGHFTVATLLKLAGIAPAVAINLAIPTFFALALASCVALGYSLVRRLPFALLAGVFAMLSGNLVGAQVLVGDLQAASPISDRLGPVSSAGSDLFVLGGIVNAVSFSWSLISGFVRGTLAVLLGIWAVLTQHATLPQYAFGSGWPWDGSRVIDGHTVITEFPFWTFLFADPHAHMWDVPFALCVLGLVFNFVSRAVPPIGPSAESSLALVPGGRLIVWPVMGMLLGAIGPTNPWDLATMLGASALALFIGRLVAGGSVLGAFGGALLRVVVLAGFALALYAPFYTHFQSFYSSIGLTLLRHQTSLGDFFTVFGFFIFVLGSYLVFAILHDTTLGLWLRTRLRAGLFTLYYWDRRAAIERYFSLARHMVAGRQVPEAAHTVSRKLRLTTLIAAAVVVPLLVFQYWGLALIVGLGAFFVLASIAKESDRDRRLRVEFRPSVPVVWLLWVAGAALLALLVAQYLVLAILVAMIAAAVLLLVDQREQQPPAVHCLHLLIIVGLGVVAAGEIVYVKDFYDADPLRFRNNTVFKLYEEGWLMLGVAGAAGLTRLLEPFLRAAPGATARFVASRAATGMGLVAAGNVRAEVRETAPARTRGLRAPGGWALAWLGALLLLFVGAEIYPLRIVPLRVSERQTWSLTQNLHIGPTLDGSLFVKYIYPDDYAAIQWLNQNVSGSPIVLQSRYGGYRDFAARVTMFTGLPSVVNWGFEASQQRYDQQPAPDGRPYPDEIGPREQDVDTIYTTTDTTLALQLLHQYHVTYVFVGHIERFGYPDDADHPTGFPATGLAKFELMRAAGQLQQVYPPAGVPTTPTSTVIYKVVR